MSSKTFIAVALVLGGAMAAGAAQAHGRDDVQWSVTIGAPVYGQPVYQPAPVYVQPAPQYYHQHHYQEPTRWDRDGDGIPNRYDPVYNPRWDRDGDGIPNRYDHYDNLRHQREHSPSRYDDRGQGGWYR